MNIDTIIQEAVKKDSIAEAANMILGDNNVKVGSSVAVINDPTYPFEGARGKVKGESAKGAGFMDVEFENGTVVPLQTSLLIPV